MSSIMKLLRRIGGAKAVPTSGDAGQLAVWKAGTAKTDAVSMYFHDGVQWVEVLDTAIKAVAVSETAPATPSVGALWFKSSTKEFSAWDGAQWSHVAFRNSSNTFTASQVIDVTDNANPALRVTQKGTGAALLVEDEANPDATPFVIDKDGKVGIGTKTPGSPLDVVGTSPTDIIHARAGTTFVALGAVDGDSGSINAYQAGVGAKRLDLQTTLGVTSIHGDVGVGIKVPSTLGGDFKTLHIDDKNGGGIRMGAGAANKFNIYYSNPTPSALIETYASVPIIMKIDGLERFRLWGTSGAILSPPTYAAVGAGSGVLVDSSGVFSRASSSAKYKKDVENLDPAIADNAVKNLRPVWYRPKKAMGDVLPGWSHFGLIAEEVDKVEKRLVNYRTMNVSYDAEGLAVSTPLATPIPEDVDYARLSVLLLDYVQRLEKRVAALEARP